MRSMAQITVVILQAVTLFHLTEITNAGADSKNAGDVQGDMDFLSEWTSWSPCSRTCGTGIKFRGRRCYRDRRPCTLIPRQYMTCNNQMCPVDARDFRDVQCSDEDSRKMVIGGKKVKFKSIFRAIHPCAKFCHTIGQRSTLFFGRVKDGTECARKPYSVCVQGKCKPIGCDRVVGSKKTLDKCQVCGGNGSSCEPFSGMINKQPDPEDKKKGYIGLFVIPLHSTMVLFSESSTNYIAIKRQTGEFIFNGGKEVSPAGKYRVGFTDFKYSRLPDDIHEAVMIMGPTTEEYHVVARLMDGDNVKTDYEYWLPKIRPTTKPTYHEEPLIAKQPDTTQYTQTTPTQTTPTQTSTTSKTNTRTGTHPTRKQTSEHHVEREKEVTPVGTTATHPTRTQTSEHHVATEKEVTPVSTTSQPTRTQTSEHHVATEREVTQVSTTSQPTRSQLSTTNHPLTEKSIKQRTNVNDPYSVKHRNSTSSLPTKRPVGTKVNDDFLEETFTTLTPSTTKKPSLEENVITMDDKETPSLPSTMELTVTSLDTQHPNPHTQHFLSTSFDKGIVNGHDRPFTTEKPVIKEATLQQQTESPFSRRPFTREEAILNGHDKGGPDNVANTFRDNTEVVEGFTTTAKTTTIKQDVRNITEDWQAMTNSSVAKKSWNTTGTSTLGEHRNETMQKATTENLKTTAKLTTMTPNTQIITENQNRTLQPTTATIVSETLISKTSQGSGGLVIEHAHETTTPITEKAQNVTLQPMTTKNQDSTAIPTLSTRESITPHTARRGLKTTSQPTTIESLNSTTQPVTKEIESATTAGKEEMRVTITLSTRKDETFIPLTENLNTNKTVTLQPGITKSRNTSIEPSTEGDGNQTGYPKESVITNNAPKRNTTGIWNTTKHHSNVGTLNTTSQPMTKVLVVSTATTVQPTATEPSGSREYPSTSGTRSTTVMTMREDKVNATQPTTIEKPNTTPQPTTKTTLLISGTIKVLTTLQPHVIENGHTAVVRSTTPKTRNTTARPKILKILNATLKQVNTPKKESQSLPYTTEPLNTTMQPSIRESVVNVTEKNDVNQWGPWTHCSRTCGIGFKVRAKPCNEDTDGKDCLSNSTQVSLCIIQPCEKKLPSWSPWGQWTACSLSCGIGVRVRIRSCRSAVVSGSTKICIGRRFQVGFCRNTNCGQQESTTISSASSSGVELSASVSEPNKVIKTSTPTESISSSYFIEPTKTATMSLMSRVLPCQDCLSTTVPGNAKPTSTPLVMVKDTGRAINGKVSSSATSTVSAKSEVSPVSPSEIPSLSRFMSSNLHPTPTVSMALTSSVSSVGASSVLAESSVSHKTITKVSSSSLASSLQSTHSLSLSETALSTMSIKSTPRVPSVSVSSSVTPLLPPPSSAVPPKASEPSIIPPPSSSLHLRPTPSSSLPSSTQSLSSASPTPSTSRVQIDATVLPVFSKSTHAVPTSKGETTATAYSLESMVTSSTTYKATHIKPSRTVDLLKKSSSVVINRKTGPSGPGECQPCRPPRKKDKHFCMSDYAIHVNVTKTYLNLNNKLMYDFHVINIYKAAQPIPERLSIRAPGNYCPCPYLETGKEYVIFGKLRHKKKSRQLRVAFNKRNFVQEWNASFDTEVISLKKRCAARTKVTAQPNTTDPPLKTTPSTVTMTTAKPIESCPLCRLSDDLGDVYCSSDYAIRAKITKYRLATNRTMYYAQLITTYTTAHQLPPEVLIRVPGDRCPCPPLTVGKEYLLVGTMKETFTGKMRLSLSLKSFVKEWNNKLRERLHGVKQKCGLPVILGPPDSVDPTTQGTTVSTQQMTTTTPTTMTTISMTTVTMTTTAVPPTTKKDAVRCPSCSKSRIGSTKQKRYCKNDQVFRGRVLSNYKGPSNRTIYLVSMVTSFKSPSELADRISIRVADNPCLCGALSTGKDYLIMGRVRVNKKGKSRMVLLRKSFVQDWQEDFDQEMEQIKTRCGNSVLEVKLKKLGVTCPTCRASSNIQDFCSSQYVFRAQIFKSYRTSANRTVYHTNVLNTYKGSGPTNSVVLLRVPGVQCHCPQLRLGREYVIMGFLKKKRKGPSVMALSRESFVQPWNEGFMEELQSLRSSCKTSGISVGSLVQRLPGQSGSGKITTPTTVPVLPSTTDVTSAPPRTRITTENDVVMTTPINPERKCSPCQTSRRRNRQYCLSDYVLVIQIQDRIHNKTSKTTQYYVTIQYTYKQQTRLDPLVIITVPNDVCNCPNLKIKNSYVVMANIERLETGEDRLVLPDTPFIKGWSKRLHKKIMQLENYCNTDHRKL